MIKIKDLLIKLKNLGKECNNQKFNKILLEIKTHPNCTDDLFKKINNCYIQDPGWLFVGIDFDSLEDKVSALTTKDPNKIKVYTDGYDGHNLRAYSYFSDKMPDISQKMDEIHIEQRFFKITQDNGEIEYVSEKDLKSKGVKIPNKI